MTRDHLILISWSLSNTWKRLLHILFHQGFWKNFTSKLFCFSRYFASTFKILQYLQRKKNCSKLYHLRSILEDEFQSACLALHSAVSRNSSIGLQAPHVKKTAVPYGLALVNPFVSCHPRKQRFVLSVEGDWFLNPFVHAENNIPWWARYQRLWNPYHWSSPTVILLHALNLRWDSQLHFSTQDEYSIAKFNINGLSSLSE